MDQYVYQFEVVQEKLKEIIDKDEVLRLRGKSIMYKLHMGRSATLALTLEVGSERMVLTAGHLKSAQRNPEPSGASTPEGSHDDEATLNGYDDVEIGLLWVDDDDDDEYEMEAAASQPLPSRSLPLDYISAVYAKNRLVSQLQKMRPVDPSAELGPSEPDLDWMLLECKDYAFRARSRNFIYLPEQLEPIPLKKIANKPRMHAAPVFMISGVRGLIKGRMLGMPTFIGSGPGKKSCKAWSVVLDNQLVVLPGESGSVVVDQDTFSVYGHVRQNLWTEKLWKAIKEGIKVHANVARAMNNLRALLQIAQLRQCILK
ncbi:hypothetical protein SLS63_002277 [Diaporthe eres]|uniref:Uncharacterized protein n=1 Tax=Diaporthe eres TaxID=83184 RepID=A0ABR1PL44_DIAER